MTATRRTVFVSYAHEDRKWADEVMKFLAPWIRDKRVDLWDDSRIKAGEKWREEIRRAMEQASVALLLVTKDFLASSFIVDQELPLLLEQAQANKLRLLWIAVGHAPYQATPLREFQAVNDPAKPLESLRPAERNKVMVQVAATIADAVTLSTFAGGLEIIDETVEPMEAALEKRPERPGRKFLVQAEYNPKRGSIAFRGAKDVITAADLSTLPDEDREFIADLEDSLKEHYKRWREVRKRLGGAVGALDPEIEKELARITILMCKDLNAILDFLREMHKYELEDHYGRYRYICQKLPAA